MRPLQQRFLARPVKLRPRIPSRNGRWRRERGGLTQRRGVAYRLPGGGRFLAWNCVIEAYVAAAKQERIKEGKYSEAAAAKGIRFIPFVMETYGKLGTKALRLLRAHSRAGPRRF